MNVIKYKLELTDNLIPALVSEDTYDYSALSLDSLDAVSDLLEHCFHLKHLAEEHTIVIGLNAKLAPIAVFEVAHGKGNCCAIAPKDILTRAVIAGASNIIIAHNHPSRNEMPSMEDKRTCRRMNDALRVCGIHLTDFIIVGDGIYSFAKEGQL